MPITRSKTGTKTHKAQAAKKMTFWKKQAAHAKNHGIKRSPLAQKMWEMKQIKAKIIEDKRKKGRGLSPTEVRELARAKKVQDDAIIHIKKIDQKARKALARKALGSRDENGAHGFGHYCPFAGLERDKEGVIQGKPTCLAHGTRARGYEGCRAKGERENCAFTQTFKIDATASNGQFDTVLNKMEDWYRKFQSGDQSVLSRTGPWRVTIKQENVIGEAENKANRITNNNNTRLKKNIFDEENESDGERYDESDGESGSEYEYI